MTDLARTHDIGSILAVDPKNPNIVYAHFEDLDFGSLHAPNAVPILRSMLEEAGVVISPNEEFWAEISPDATVPGEVNAVVLNDAQLTEGL